MRVTILDFCFVHHIRIMRSVDGSPIYQSEVEFRYHQQMWDRLREIMDCVGFPPEVQIVARGIVVAANTPPSRGGRAVGPDA